MSMKQKFRFLLVPLCAALCLGSNKVLAAECDSAKGLAYPTVTGSDYYGSGQTDSFRCSMTGSTDLTPEQMRERADLAPPSLDYRWYFRLGGNAAAQGLSVKNVSTGSSASDYTLGDDTVKNASNNFELGLGYVWTDFAVDVEWLAVQSISYTSSVVGLLPNYTVNSRVSGDAILLNLYYFFQDLYNVKLYGIADVGFTQNRSNTTLTGGNADSNFILNKYSVSYGLGFGGRFNIVSKLYADMAARYLFLGDAKMQTNVGLILKAKRTWLGASFRLLWLW